MPGSSGRVQKATLTRSSSHSLNIALCYCKHFIRIRICRASCGRSCSQKQKTDNSLKSRAAQGTVTPFKADGPVPSIPIPIALVRSLPPQPTTVMSSQSHSQPDANPGLADASNSSIARPLQDIDLARDSDSDDNHDSPPGPAVAPPNGRA
ncbi:hypothetical protein BCR44DRAFT_1182405 [Catenaria anguillulae PL171]|uniref:Uncharacterized protein n=1 Tax=Catenaria anguillulae PL171 TaxID=765915 RepID=A0A1Y2HHT8_9FUNG|nr:hypothetical protein BCR44DRAFT_1182405 [Catenaria anguillulae PL171]